MAQRAITGAFCNAARVCGTVVATIVACGTQPAVAQVASPLTVNGTLIIDGGGTNTSTIRYTAATVSTGAGSTTIRLSAAYPTLVIRGGQLYAAACGVAGDCWDSNRCMTDGASFSGVCGWSGLELPPACGDQSVLAGKLDDCASLWGHVTQDPTPFSGQAARTDQCISAGSQVAALTASCPAQMYRDAYDKVVFDVLAGSQRALQTSGGQLVQSDVRTHLQRIADWYAAYRQIYPASAGDPANQRTWAQTSRVLGGFWKAAYANVGVPPPGSSNPSDALLDQLFQNGVEADRTVLLAALTSPVPIRTAPLVELMGDALQSMSTRLGQVGRYHDLACRFRNNPTALQTPCASGPLKTEISELVRLLSAGAHPSDLAAVLASPPPATVTANWARWKSVFNALSSQQSGTTPAFQAAVLDALPGVTTYTPDLLAPPPPTPGAPPPAPTLSTPPVMGLSKVIQEARARTNSYQQNGLFDSRYQGILRAGVQQDRVNGVIALAQSRTADLRTQITNYKTTRLQLANTVLQQMTNLASQQNVIDEITQRVAKERQLREDLAGLRNTIEVQEARYGDFMQAFNAVTEIVKANPGTAVTHLTANVSVTAADVRWPASTGLPAKTDALATFAAPAAGLTWPLVALKGDIVNINVSGTWSPTCAMRMKGQFVNPTTGEPASISVPDPALTGPEGYLLSLSNGTFNATSNQSVHSVDHYSNSSVSSKYCGGLGRTLGVTLQWGPFSATDSAHLSAEWCAEWDHGTRVSDVTSNSVSNGTESRMSAAFATGLRVPGTPFPTFPAGSLLLLQVSRGGLTRGDIVDVQVLQKPYSAVVVGGDTDLYLVVNDIRNDVGSPACGPPNTSALTLSVNQMRPFGTVAAQLGQGMATALADLRDQQGLLLEQGRVGPQQMTELRDQAFVDLVLACGTNCSGVSYYPPEVLRLFEAWVSKSLATIERKVDARALEREIALIELQHAALAHDYKNLNDQARLLALIPTWLLKDLGTHILESNTQSLLDLLVADLYPIIDLRQPTTLQNVDPTLLNVLLGSQPDSTGQLLDWTGNLVSWANAAASASDNVVARLQDALLNSPPLNDRLLILGIPNPAFPVRTGNWQQVTPERAQAVWDAIAAAAPLVSVPLYVTDLYSMVAGSTHDMLCNEAEPVITAVGLYMIRPGSFEQYSGLTIPVSADRNVHFTDVGVVKGYRIDNDDWLSLGARLMSGSETVSTIEADLVRLMADSATPLYRVGNGLSPFTQLDIALPGITSAPSGPPPALGASELLIAFRAATRQVASVHLQPMCP
jgi:hypothetical protein